MANRCTNEILKGDKQTTILSAKPVIVNKKYCFGVDYDIDLGLMIEFI